MSSSDEGIGSQNKMGAPLKGRGVKVREFEASFGELGAGSEVRGDVKEQEVQQRLNL